jgi:hypothetical protein
MSKVSVLSNAVLVWNTARIGTIVDERAATGHECCAPIWHAARRCSTPM